MMNEGELVRQTANALCLHSLLAQELKMYTELTPKMEARITFRENKQTQPVVFRVSCLVNFGETNPIIPISPVVASQTRIVATYMVETVRYQDREFPKDHTELDVREQFARWVVTHPKPKVTLIFTGISAARRGFRYPIGFHTGIYLHAVLKTQATTRHALIQLVELAMPSRDNEVIEAPLELYAYATRLIHLQLTLRFELPVSEATASWQLNGTNEIVPRLVQSPEILTPVEDEGTVLGNAQPSALAGQPLFKMPYSPKPP